MESRRINSNINLYYIPMTKLKTTKIGVYIHRDLDSREISKNALLPYVLKRGCALCPDSSSVAKYLENLYGAMFGVSILKLGSDQVMYFGFDTISDKYAQNGENLTSELIRFILSVLFEPAAITDEVVAQEKKNAKDRISAVMNNKAQYALHRCSEVLCENDSYALPHLGTEEGISEITAQGLKEHYENIITSSVIDFYVCGETDIDKLSGVIGEFVKDKKFSEAHLPEQEIFKSSAGVKKEEEHMDVVQGSLCMGFKTGIAANSEDYAALMVMNSVFGEGAHSKLFNNVREKLSLCYYASSTLVKNKGLMFVNSGIEFDNFDKAKDEILAQLENVKKGEISELEFSSGVSMLVNRLESYRDDQASLQLFYLGEKVSGTEYDIDSLKEKIKRVTIDDIKRAAQGVELGAVYFISGREEK